MYIWGKGRAAGRVGSGQTFCRQSRVGSGQRFAGSGRVQEKWPVDIKLHELDDVFVNKMWMEEFCDNYIYMPVIQIVTYISN